MTEENITNSLDLSSLPQIQPPFDIKSTLVEETETRRSFKYTCQGTDCIFSFTKVGFPSFEEAQLIGKEYARQRFELMFQLNQQEGKTSD